jgi:hypothetical protein
LALCRSSRLLEDGLSRVDEAAGNNVGLNGVIQAGSA